MKNIRVDKRGLLRAIAGVGTAVGGGVVALGLGTQPAVAASGFTASDVSVSSNDGTLSSLTITPDVTVDWSGQETAVSEVDMTWTVARLDSSGTVVNSGQAGGTQTASVSTASKSGSVNHAGAEIDLLSVLSASAFSADTDGGTTDTTVQLTMDVVLYDGSRNQITTASGVLQGQYTVSVTNNTSTVSAGGTANTSGS